MVMAVQLPLPPTNIGSASRQARRLCTPLVWASWAQAILAAALLFFGCASVQAAQLPARSLIIQIEAPSGQADAVIGSLSALQGAEALVFQRKSPAQAAQDASLVVRLTDPHNGGRTLVAIQGCAAQTCQELEAKTALVFARNAGPADIGEALRRALGGFAQSEQAGNAGLALPELVVYLSRQLAAPLRRPELIDPGYHIDLATLAPAPADLARATLERLEALSLLQSNDAVALQNYLRSCHFCSERAAINDKLLSLLAGDTNTETQLLQWQAVVAGASSQAAFGFIDAYPNTSIAETIIRDVAQVWPDQLAAVEAKLWTQAAGLADPSVMRSLVLACVDCSFAEGLEPETFQSANPALDRETELWQQARLDNTADSYGRYLESCELCLFSPEALRQQQQAGPDPEALKDRKLLAALDAEPSLSTMQAYLEGCQICEDRADIQARFDEAFKRDTAEARCLDLARNPSAGGDGLQPREAAEAEEACLGALEQSSSPALRLVLAEAYRLQGKAEDAVAAFDRIYRDGEMAGLDGLALSLFQFSQAGSDGRRRLASIMAEGTTSSGVSPRRALVEALVQIEQLSSAERLLPQPEIVRLLEVAADGQEADAAYTLGLLYSFGQLTERSLDKAALAFQSAAALGHVEASAYYADHVERGLGVAADYKLAAELYYQALKDQSDWAATRLIEQGRSRPLEVMKHIQQFLRSDGFYRGPIDGVAGGTTTKALNRAKDEG